MYSPFEIVEEMEEPVEAENYGGDDEPSMMKAIMRESSQLLSMPSMEYMMPNQISKLRKACNKNKNEVNNGEEEKMRFIVLERFYFGDEVLPLFETDCGRFKLPQFF
ncbi:hypothetical protein Ahy_B04g069995 [Arachis hypogaea]|uniref:Uncharacterized protein n=1 Tax=Arachis hypogaea TaxID=3818 RepID=A0A444ZE69_ARAHY|nr:hypothetical protein Ahy_B04g069995 [Arachis hypogaea]